MLQLLAVAGIAAVSSRDLETIDEDQDGREDVYSRPSHTTARNNSSTLITVRPSVLASSDTDTTLSMRGLLTSPHRLHAQSVRAATTPSVTESPVTPTGPLATEWRPRTNESKRPTTSEAELRRHVIV